MSRWWTTIVLVIAGPSLAAEMRSLDVHYEDGHYSLESKVWFDVEREPIYQVFSTWDISAEFSRAIVEARDLAPDDEGRPGFYVVNRGCVLFFCKSLKRQGYVERERPELLRAFADPELSDFEISNETWAFVEENGGTVITYTLHVKPAFWVPPAIGPFLIQRKLRKSAGEALDRVEAIAQRYSEKGTLTVD
jgi:hypothetical protein